MHKAHLRGKDLSTPECAEVLNHCVGDCLKVEAQKMATVRLQQVECTCPSNVEVPRPAAKPCNHASHRAQSNYARAKDTLKGVSANEKLRGASVENVSADEC